MQKHIQDKSNIHKIDCIHNVYTWYLHNHPMWRKMRQLIRGILQHDSFYQYISHYMWMEIYACKAIFCLKLKKRNRLKLIYLLMMCVYIVKSAHAYIWHTYQLQRILFIMMELISAHKFLLSVKDLILISSS